MTTSRSTIRPGDRLPDDDALLAWVEFLHQGIDAPRFSLWITFLDAEDRPLRAVVPIDDVPPSPEDEMVDNLVGIVQDVLADQAPGGSTVLMLERPGTDAVTPGDGLWFVGLHGAAARRGVRLRGVFLATGRRVRALTPDDVPA
ncbi:hypothetical protein V5D56_10500 [Cellulosimicrobium sp. PMB13]|uniref:hypothetical protein n=1 Tax=Cellulosimicrobium sp. PMB13 TaxID=3120158 RepID=UPI003F4C4FE0